LQLKVAPLEVTKAGAVKLGEIDNYKKMLNGKD